MSNYIKKYLLLIEKVISENKLVSDNYISDYVESIHGKPEDFDEGDINDRIYKYSEYKLTKIEIDDLDLEEFYVDEDYVQDLELEIQKEGKYSPIVFDPDQKSIIDGIHRANALHNLGKKYINAYVGVTLSEENVDEEEGYDE